MSAPLFVSIPRLATTAGAAGHGLSARRGMRPRARARTPPASRLNAVELSFEFVLDGRHPLDRLAHPEAFGVRRVAQLLLGCRWRRSRRHRHRHQHARGEVDEPVGVAPLVVVPGDDLDLGLVDHAGQRRVEDRRVRGLDDVGGDDRVLAVGEDAGQRAGVGARGEGAVDLLDARRAARPRPSGRRSSRSAAGRARRSRCSLPASSGMTSPSAFAAPVDVGIEVQRRPRGRGADPCAARRAGSGRRCRRGSSSSGRAGCRPSRAGSSRPARGSWSCRTRW